MAPRFTYEDSRGDTQLKSWALPLIVIAICVPIIAAFSLSTRGVAVGLAVGALAAVALVVWAVRSRPFGAMEVAEAEPGGRRVLVVATEEIQGAALDRVVKLAAGADDVRVLVPAPSRRLDRWLSAEDSARGTAQDWLARSAGALTASGLKVSGSVGDADPVQAVADELRSFAADEVLVVSDPRSEKRVEDLRTRLALPMTRVSAS